MDTSEWTSRCSHLPLAAFIALLVVGSLTPQVTAQTPGPVRPRPSNEQPIAYRTREAVAAERTAFVGNLAANARTTRLASQPVVPPLPPHPDGGDPVLETGPILVPGHVPGRIRDYSRIHIDLPKRREIRLHDIVTIIVDEKSEVIMNQRFNRQRTGRFKAELKEFIRLGETGNLTEAALQSPKIDSQLTNNLNTSGVVTDQEGIKYRIAAKVTDVKPNGTILLEARKVLQSEDDVSEYTLTGEVRAEDINPDNTVSSENIANSSIVKRQKGRVYDSAKRNWGTRLLDFLSPF